MANALFIDEFPVRLEGNVSWKQFRGTSFLPFEFPMMPKDYEALRLKVCGQSPGKVKKNRDEPIQSRENDSRQSEVTLKFVKDGGKTFEFKRLVFLGEGVASSPFHRICRLADLRCRWPSNEIHFNVNERRVSGKRRVVSPHGVPLATVQINDDITYAKLSMNPNTGFQPWTAPEVIEEVLSRVVGKKDVDWQFDQFFTSRFESLVQDFLISDKGDVAVAKALGLIPGAEIYQDIDGKFIVTTRIPGKADGIIKSLGDPLTGGGFIRKLDKSADRYTSIDILYEREIGYRFDYDGRAIVSRSKTDPWAQCVLKSTEPNTTLPSGETIPTGTFVEEAQMLAVWDLALQASQETDIQRIIAKYPLNIQNINRFFIANLDRIYTLLGTVADAYDDVLGRHIQEIKSGHRQQLQINPLYVDACSKIILKAPAYIDPENGTEQESPIFSDYAVLPTAKAISQNDRLQDMAFNFRSGARSVRGSVITQDAKLEGKKQAQARASWISQDLGIFLVRHNKDPMGFQARVVPSAIDNPSIPSGNYFANVKDFNQARLDNNHDLNIIVALVPRVPNDDRRLFRVTVTPADILSRFGFDVGGGCFTPFEDRVSQGLIAGQWPYEEKNHRAVQEVLGIVDGPGDIGDPINIEDLVDFAQAKALSAWLPLVDHFQGRQLISMRNDIPLVSEIESVTHSMSGEGALYSMVSCEAPLKSATVQPEAFLSQSTRRIIQRAVNITGA